MPYSEFLGKFPKVQYDINKSLYGSKETVTNIFFRVAFIKKTLNNISSYYVYELGDGDSPESLADNVYGDTGLSWMIIYANNIVDPQYDWFKPYEVFRSYLVEKYKSQVANSEISDITINNPGYGYSNGYISFTGGYGSNANARIEVDLNGSVQSIVINSVGNNYFTYDSVTANVAHLGGSDAVLTVKLTEPTAQQVLNYTQITPHHYEKVVERTDTFNLEPQVNRYVVNRNILTDGAIYVDTEANGSFEIGETAFISETVKPGDSFYKAKIDFQGTVIDYSVSNGRLVLANTTGRLVLYNDIKGNTSGHTAVVLKTSFDDRPYEYFDNMAGFQYVQMISYDNVASYSVTQVTHSDTVSLYDWEDERNESRRWIKIIKPDYVQNITKEFENYLTNYNIPKTEDIFGKEKLKTIRRLT